MKLRTLLLLTLFTLSSCVTISRPAQEDPFPLHTAAVHYPTRIEALLSDGVDIDTLNNFGCTALQEAVRFQNGESVSQLLAAGANPNAGTDKDAPLSIAARTGNTEIVRLLVKHRANPNGKSIGKTALHNATIFGRTEIVRILVSCEDIDLNVQEDGTGYTALHLAVLHERPDFISILLKHGIRSDIKDCVGNTALDLASHLTNKSMSVLLQNTG
jgi:serine/threonine-protein phosphatase 6 regulatory ankyrin repeat subunit B